MFVPVILMFENDPVIAQDLSGRLRDLGYHLLPVVESMVEAQTIIKQVQPGLILLDLAFMELDAVLQLAADIRNTLSIPIVYIIPEVNPKNLNHAGLVGASGFLIPPFNNAAIQAIIELAGIQHEQQNAFGKQQNLQNAILKNIAEGIIAVDDKGLIQFINPVAAAMTGIAVKDAAGASINNLLTISEKTSRQDVSASDLFSNWRSTGPLSAFDIFVRGPNGQHTPMDGSVAPLRDELGRPSGAVIVLRNLSDLHYSLQHIEAQAARTEALLRIITRINTQMNIPDMLDSFLQETTQALDADASVVFLLNEDEDKYKIVSGNNRHEKLPNQPFGNFSLDRGLIQTLLSGEQDVLCLPNIQELNGLPYQDFCKTQDIRTLILTQLTQGDHILGLLIIVSVGREREYSRDELQFIKGLAEQASLAIEKGQLFENLLTSRGRLQAVTRQLVEAQEKERHAIARELHDQVGQELTGLQFMLQAGKRQAGENLHAVFDEAQQLVTSLMKQIRELSLKLAPSMLDDMGLLRTLLWHFDQYSRQTGIRVQFSSNCNEMHFPYEIEISAYRIIQEALTNVARYTQVGHVEVALNAEEQMLTVLVRDAGAGFDPQKTVDRKTTFGLTSMKERAHLVGGKLTINTSLGIGTEVIAVLPISKSLERRSHDR